MSLPFPEINLVDHEYIAGGGNRPNPVAICFKELRSGRSARLWHNEFPADPPYAVDESALFVSYNAPAELGCHLVLGWPMPVRILDLYVEFRAAWNGARPPAGYGLLGALSAYGLPSITKAEKESGRDLVLRGAPWSEAEKQAILDYCWTDVAALELLLPRMLPGIVQWA